MYRLLSRKSSHFWKSWWPLMRKRGTDRIKRFKSVTLVYVFGCNIIQWIIPKNQVSTCTIAALCLYNVQRENLVFKKSLCTSAIIYHFLLVVVSQIFLRILMLLPQRSVGQVTCCRKLCKSLARVWFFHLCQVFKSIMRTDEPLSEWVNELVSRPRVDV